ncbi:MULTISPECIES: aldo/keto reductase [Streptomycetaceae]|uniref:Aldo/keto reductase n=1 Tax=Streptantibioticus cattleyicolor (strain ATCC 35852 / DSM 46488 / JCM 4925 / NBRC 14057 / NRRL 8057) TaxID=1003195 RepID=F8JRI2_STREN|nr:aldo/keto reductase [Streptantibioticus cattleyicolor]AEW96690.1 aldo/keto reductase [Streptantibioticus cattleyicolor NRRL 8057 = DSM 46488]MYS61181.1 aldo/keto reductase [Streptomyces sp. SID5468]CCB77030.1 Oxidoreductase [Streptantibioticus cattleyicolor NRRL 8057 = DSM 46488]
MERRTIGAAALEVGSVGLGCMPMSWAYTTSQRDGERSLRAVHAALDAGTTLLDTADMYGPFTNELLVGRVLRERRREAFVSTKCGLLVGEQHIVANGRPGYVKRACDASLRRLQTDVIDLYQLHRVDPEVPVEDTWGAMSELVAAGKVRALGFCAVGAARVGYPRRGARRSGGAARRADPVRPGPYADTLDRLERVQQVFPVACVQAELSVWSPEALCDLLPWCASRGVGFLAAMPLGNGFLTGTLTPGQGFEPDDVRARHPRFTADMMAANQPIVAGLRRVAARHGATPAQIALAWVLAQGPYVVPVPGAKKERWTAENAAAAGVRLGADDLAEIAGLPPALGSWD